LQRLLPVGMPVNKASRRSGLSVVSDGTFQQQAGAFTTYD